MFLQLIAGGNDLAYGYGDGQIGNLCATTAHFERKRLRAYCVRLTSLHSFRMAANAAVAFSQTSAPTNSPADSRKADVMSAPNMYPSFIRTFERDLLVDRLAMELL